MGGELITAVDRRAAVAGLLALGALLVGGTRGDELSAAGPPAVDVPPACTAEAIGADTALQLRPAVECSAGFAMAMFADGTTACTSIETCEYPQIFHVTQSGWVYDGVHGRTCAEDLGVYFMSPETAATFAPVCDPASWPAPETVRQGDQGAAVMYVQIALVSAGFDEAIDGSFGSGTTAAVRSFQSEHGLEVTGTVGPETHALLGTGPNPPSPTSTTTSTTIPATFAPGSPRACDVETIRAESGLTMIAVRACSAGWAQGMLSTTCSGTEPGAECEDADVFHVTERGWVHDGTMYAYCAEQLAISTGMSIYTAVELTAPCGDVELPGRTNIAPGTSGQRVTQLQIALVAVGYPIAVDGTYGLRTEAAVRDFQQRNGLAPDGIAGELTQEALGI